MTDFNKLADALDEITSGCSNLYEYELSAISEAARILRAAGAADVGHLIDNYGLAVAKGDRDATIKYRAALESALRVAMAGQGWQPIETAPKDGTSILLSNGETVAQGEWLHAEPYVKEIRNMDGRYVDQEEFDGHDDWVDCSGGMLPSPTHWMPLPAAPAAQAGAQEPAK